MNWARGALVLGGWTTKVRARGALVLGGWTAKVGARGALVLGGWTAKVLDLGKEPKVENSVAGL